MQSFKFISEHYNINLLARPQINAGTRSNAPGVYFKSSGFHPAFKRGWRLIGARRLIEKIQYFQTHTLLFSRKKYVKLCVKTSA